MISKEQVEHIAKLARIRVGNREVEKLQKDFSAVLEYFEVLSRADTDGVEPMTHSVSLQNVTRGDAAGERRPELVNKLLSLMSETKEGFLKVKSILKQ